MKTSTKDIENLHHKYAPSAELFDKVWTHCQIDWDIAKQLIDANHLKINRDLVRVGCLAHDIGVYVLRSVQTNTGGGIEHGILGAEILMDEGFGPEIAQFALNHIGSGLTKNEIIERDFPIPPADYLPQNDEQKLVAYADKFHTKKPTFVDFEKARAKMAGYGPEDLARFDEMASQFGRPDLKPIAEKYQQDII